jgi:hypothetical protein
MTISNPCDRKSTHDSDDAGDIERIDSDDGGDIKRIDSE